MRLLACLGVLFPSLALAQPGVTPATTPEVRGLARGAHAAGERGDCVGARTLAARINQLDPTFYVEVIVKDTAITQCKPVARPTQGPPYEQTPDPDSPLPKAKVLPRTTPANGDASDRHLGMQFVLGAGMSLGLGTAAFFLVEDFDDPGAAVGTIAASVVLGSTLGVVVAGSDAATDYSLPFTLTCSVMGTGIAAAAIFNDRDPSIGSALVITAVFPTLATMVGYNLTRKPVAFAPPLTALSNDTTAINLLARSF